MLGASPSDEQDVAFLVGGVIIIARQVERSVSDRVKQGDTTKRGAKLTYPGESKWQGK
jgi:hypothetical protein